MVMVNAPWTIGVRRGFLSSNCAFLRACAISQAPILAGRVTVLIDGNARAWQRDPCAYRHPMAGAQTINKPPGRAV